MNLLRYLPFYPVALAGGAAALRLYSHWVCSTNKFRVIREIRAKLIVNCQLSILNFQLSNSGSSWYSIY